LVTLSQLAEIPYLDLSEPQGRFLSTLCFYDNGWHLWIEGGEKREILIHMKPVDAAEMLYFGKEPAKESDLYWRFLNFLAQRASTPSVAKAFNAIRDDIYNLSAALAKIELLQTLKDKIPHGRSRMAGTEVEYIVVLCRGLFDFLQEFLRGLWETVHLTDQSIDKKPLKKSFNDMVTYKGEPAETVTTVKRFGLPTEIAACYTEAAKVFSSLRTFRDNVVHNGTPSLHIYELDDGFFTDAKFAPLPNHRIWHDHERAPNELVPLLPALQILASETMTVCDNFSEALEKVIGFPAPFVPGMQLYIRSYFTENLSKARFSATERSSLLADASSPLMETGNE
jgi:hypothetical protein